VPWFKVDDSFYDHPKVFDAPDCALALWIRAGTWAARNLTDGFVPTELAKRLCDDPETAIGQLLKRGLWKTAKGGYRFHDWKKYQVSASEMKELRRKRADAGRLGGLAAAASKRPASARANAEGVAKQIFTPVPSRPSSTSVVINSPAVPRAGPEEKKIDYEDLAHKLHPLIGIITTDHAHRISELVLTGANGQVTNPTSYILTAVAREPARYRPTNTPPHVRDLCRHGLVGCKEPECV
jgi:hypothetical protein